MKTFTLQATLLVSIPVKAETKADSERKLREQLASSRLYVGMLDDEPIVVAAEIEGDLDFLDASECDDLHLEGRPRSSDAPPRAHRFPAHRRNRPRLILPTLTKERVMPKEIVSTYGASPSLDADQKTRRAALCALVGASALTIPTIVAIAGRSSDPVFAAIERHEAAYEACNATRFAIDEPINDPDAPEVSEVEWDALQRAHENEIAAFSGLLTHAPTSSAGVRAIVAHLIAIDDGRLSQEMRQLLALLLDSPLFAC